MDKIYVTAADGRLVPIHGTVATAPGLTQLVIKPGDVVELPLTALVQRRLAAGDLIRVAMPSTATASKGRK
jgi:hypothetical protein